MRLEVKKNPNGRAKLILYYDNKEFEKIEQFLRGFAERYRTRNLWGLGLEAEVLRYRYEERLERIINDLYRYFEDRFAVCIIDNINAPPIEYNASTYCFATVNLAILRVVPKDSKVEIDLDAVPPINVIKALSFIVSSVFSQIILNMVDNVSVEVNIRLKVKKK